MKRLGKYGLSSPWVKFFREIEALFGDDPEVKVTFDQEEPEVKLLVENADKADAISKLLPVEKVFGNVILKITVVPANNSVEPDADIIKTAFKGNPAFSYITGIQDIFSREINYVVFKNKVVQFFNDDLSDINGNCSTLYQEIAKDVLGEKDNIYYCTDTPDGLQKPLGEWP